MTETPIDAGALFNRLTIELGLKVTLAKTGRLSIKPKKKITPEIATLVLAHQAALEALLRQEYGVALREADDTRPDFDVDEPDLKIAGANLWQLVQAVNEPTLFRQAEPAWLEHDVDGHLVMRSVDLPRLRHWLTQRIYCCERTAHGARAATPSNLLLNELMATPDPPLPICTRIVRTPIFAADGTLHARPGYDARTRTWLDVPAGFQLKRVSATPDAAEIAAAAATLMEPWMEFPIATAAGRAHVVAVPLTVLARELIPGPTPLTNFTKPAPGTGGTLAAKVAAFIPSGIEPPIMTQGEDDSEWRKRILAALLRAPDVIFVDNLRGMVDSAALSAVLTATVYEDRALGRSELLRIANRAVWISTANNAMLSNELVRRSVRVKLDAGVERPWAREHAFRHHPLLTWVAEHRADLVHAAHTLIAAWLAAGRPAGGKVLASFEAWSHVIGGILAVAGIPGFLEDQAELYDEQDVETDDVKRFLVAWWSDPRSRALTPAELLTIATKADVALPLGGKDEGGRAISLGMWLRRHRDRPYDLPNVGTVRVSKTTSDTGGAAWDLKRAPGGTSGTSGDFLHPSRARNEDLNGRDVAETRLGSGADLESPLRSPKSPETIRTGQDRPRQAHEVSR